MPKCTITGNIYNSLGNPIDGALRVTLDSVIADEFNQIYEKYPDVYIVDNGAINVLLEESESHKITYHFELFVLRADSPNPIASAIFPEDFEAQAIADFHAVVPNLPAYTWDLIRFETGITTQSLSTAAFAVAKEMLENDNLLPIITSSLGFYNTATKPASSPDIIWFDPATNTPFQYDSGQAKFLSPIYTHVISMESGNSTFPYEIIESNPFIEDFDEILIRSYTIKFTQVGTINATDNYTINTGIIAPNTTTKSIRASLDTDSGSAGNLFTQKFNDNVAYNASSINNFFLEIIQNNNPGVLLQGDVVIAYQLVK